MKIVLIVQNAGTVVSVYCFVRVKVRAPLVLIINTISILKKHTALSRQDR